MLVITPEIDLDKLPNNKKIFLSGSMGKINGENWRDLVIKRFDNIENDSFSIINPSVDDWDNVVGEESLNNEKFIKQILWERQALSVADIVFMVFTKDSPALGTLLEFSLVCSKNKENAIVFIEDGYKKEAALALYCEENNIPHYIDFDTALNMLNLNIIRLFL